MVLTSRRRAMFDNTRGSDVKREAQRIGRAAFFAPEILTSPLSGAPPKILKRSIGISFLGSAQHRLTDDLRFARGPLDRR